MNYGIHKDVGQDGIIVFEKMAAVLGLHYAEWQNTDPAAHFIVNDQRPGIPPVDRCAAHTTPQPQAAHSLVRLYSVLECVRDGCHVA